MTTSVPTPPVGDDTSTLLIIGATGELGAATLLAARAASLSRPIHATLHATPPAPALAAAASAWHPLDTGDHVALRRLVIDVAPAAVLYCAVPGGHGGANSSGADAAPFRGGVVEDVAAAAEAVAMAGGRFVGVSTDLVFDGTKGSPYTEADAVAPLSAYGKCKAEMEARLTAMGGDDVLVCRTSLILSMAGAGMAVLPRSGSASSDSGAAAAAASPPPSGPRFLDAPMGKGLRFVADCVAGRKGDLALFSDEVRHMSWAHDLGAALVELAARRGVGGLLHLVADAPTNRWEVAVALARRAGLEGGGGAASGLSASSGLNRPTDLRLDTGRLAGLGLRTRLRGALERLDALP